MSAAPAPKLYTFEEFCEVIEDGQKADLIDGEIISASPDSIRANSIQSFLHILIDGFSEARGDLGSTYVSRVALRLGQRNGPEPDILFVLRKHRDRVKSGHVLGGADLVVEVVSEDSARRDYVRKRAIYEDAGIAEDWVVDPVGQRALFLRLEGGEYGEVGVEDGIFRSQVLAGFWLDVNWLFRDPLPRKSECLQQILSGAPGE